MTVLLLYALLVFVCVAVILAWDILAVRAETVSLLDAEAGAPARCLSMEEILARTGGRAGALLVLVFEVLRASDRAA